MNICLKLPEASELTLVDDFVGLEVFTDVRPVEAELMLLVKSQPLLLCVLVADGAEIVETGVTSCLFVVGVQAPFCCPYAGVACVTTLRPARPGPVMPPAVRAIAFVFTGWSGPYWV